MGSAAKSVPSDPPKMRADRVKLTMPGDPPRPAPTGTWSQGPVYKRLDSDFLQRPLIPKAPPAPRLRIDHVNGTLRVVDAVNAAKPPKDTKNSKGAIVLNDGNPAETPALSKVLDISDMPETVSLPQLARARRLSPQPNLTHVSFPLWAILVGFAAGLVAALLFGWF